MPRTAVAVLVSIETPRPLLFSHSLQVLTLLAHKGGPLFVQNVPCLMSAGLLLQNLPPRRHDCLSSTVMSRLFIHIQSANVDEMPGQADAGLDFSRSPVGKPWEQDPVLCPVRRLGLRSPASSDPCGGPVIAALPYEMTWRMRRAHASTNLRVLVHMLNSSIQRLVRAHVPMLDNTSPCRRVVRLAACKEALACRPLLAHDQECVFSFFSFCLPFYSPIWPCTLPGNANCHHGCLRVVLVLPHGLRCCGARITQPLKCALPAASQPATSYDIVHLRQYERQTSTSTSSSDN